MIDKLINSSLFTEIKDKLRKEHERQEGGLNAKEIAAYAIKFFIEWTQEDEAGYKWLTKNHPILKALSANDEVYVYTGCESLPPETQVDPDDLMIACKDQMSYNRGRDDCIYLWTGPGFLDPGMLTNDDFIGIYEKEGRVCSRNGCDNEVVARWCVDHADNGELLCNYCASTENKGGDLEQCKEGRDACRNCGYGQTFLPVESH